MTRSIAMLALAAMLALTGGSVAHAQAFGFSISSGGHGHHHHHCRPGYSFGFFSPPPPPVYVVPRVYAPPPVYVYPAPVATVAPAPVYAAAPVPAPQTNTAWKTKTQPAVNALPTSQRQVTIVRNPARSGGPVAFVVDDENEVALDEGQSHSLVTGGAYTIEFDRGGDFGSAKKTLGPGVYEFVVTDHGWDLVNPKEVDRTAARPSVKRNELPKTR